MQTRVAMSLSWIPDPGAKPGPAVTELKRRPQVLARI